MEMKLLLKFNLVLLVLFSLGIVAAASVSRSLLQRNAREEIYEAAKLLIDGALAVREYTSTNIAPLLGERDTPNGRMLFLARPLKAGAACLRCHDTAERAPPTMIAKYGPSNGFGWKVGEIIGAQIVQVPAAAAEARAEATFRVFTASLIGVLLTIGLALNGLLWWMFIRPVTEISSLADQISLGAMDSADFVARSHDEIGSLAMALSRMRRSLVQAMKLLEA